MSKRLYLLSPDINHCKNLVADLRKQGIADRHMHSIGGFGVELDDLPAAGLLQRTELLRGLLSGMGMGGSAGYLGVVLAIEFPGPALSIDESALYLGALVGAIFGGIISSMIKIHEHHHKLDDFETEIERGAVLLMVDVPKQRVPEFMDLLHRHHPQIKICT